MNRFPERTAVAVPPREPSERARHLRRGFGAGAMLFVLALHGSAFAQKPESEGNANGKVGLGAVIDRASQGVVLIRIDGSNGQKLGLGSGFLIDDKGLVATNLHVVRRAVKAEAQLRDGTKVAVKGLRAFDKTRDLAVIELEQVPPKAKALPLGPKTPPAQGDPVTAVGHPRGLSFSATDGIVSAIRRDSDEDQVKPEDDRIWVQTTAALAGGNSGGPLLSATGEVVGINTMVSQDGAVAFAVHVSHLSDLLTKARSAAMQPLPGQTGSELYNPLADFEPAVTAVLDDYRDAMAQHGRMLESTLPFLRRVVDGRDHPGPKYARRFVQMAEHQRRTTTAFQALYLACLIDKSDGPGEALKRALDLLLEDHIQERWMAQAIPGLANQSHEAVADFFRKLAVKSPHQEVRASACFYLASALRQKPKYDDDEVLALLKRCAGEFKDVRLTFEADNQSKDVVLGPLVKPVLFEVEFLSIGRTAPDIVGTDVDGKTFKLSDYRGKVVVLDFFADWCPYCVRMYPEERELTEKLADQPFAILGVSCDSRETLRQIVADKKITWRCWSDGKQGPVAETWQIDGFPRMYIIDHDGVIRSRYDGQTKAGELEKAVRAVMDKLPKADPAEKTDAKTK